MIVFITAKLILLASLFLTIALCQKFAEDISGNFFDIVTQRRLLIGMALLFTCLSFFAELVAHDAVEGLDLSNRLFFLGLSALLTLTTILMVYNSILSVRDAVIGLMDGLLAHRDPHHEDIVKYKEKDLV